MMQLEPAELELAMLGAPVTFISFYALADQVVIASKGTVEGEVDQGVSSVVEMGAVGLSYMMQDGSMALLPGCSESNPTILRLMMLKDDIPELIDRLRSFLD